MTRFTTAGRRTTRDVGKLAGAWLGALLPFALEAQPVAAPSGGLPTLDCVIQPSEIIDVGAAVPGVLESIDFDRGDMVERGQLLARLEAGVERATAELARVRATLDTSIELRQANAQFFGRNQSRSETLVRDSAISAQQMDQLETEALLATLQVRQEQDNQRLAKLELVRAREALERRMIKSPIDGVVIERYRGVGEYIEDKPVLRLAQLDPLHVETLVPVDWLGRIAAGMHAQVTPAVAGQAPRMAQVERVDRVADAASGTFSVRLALPNPNHDIATGVRCSMNFLAQQARSPLQAAAYTADAAPDPAVKTATIAQAVKSQSPVPPPRKPARTAAPANNASPPEQALCRTAGPISTRSRALRILDTLAIHGADGSLREAHEQNAAQHMILALETPRAADVKSLVANLRAANLDDFHPLRKGQYAGRISLGLYRSVKYAQERQKLLADAGVLSELVPRHPSKSTWFVDATVPASITHKQIQKALREVAPTATLSAVACDVMLVQTDPD